LFNSNNRMLSRAIRALSINEKNKTIIESTFDILICKCIAALILIFKDKRYKFVNKNNYCLLDIGLFLIFTCKASIYAKTFVRMEKRRDIDAYAISALSTAFQAVFKIDISNQMLIKLLVDRHEYYNEIFEETVMENDYHDALMAIFNEANIIIRMDIINNSASLFSCNSPQYLLSTFEDNCLCQLECKILLELCKSFNTEIESCVGAIQYEKATYNK